RPYARSCCRRMVNYNCSPMKLRCSFLCLTLLLALSFPATAQKGVRKGKDKTTQTKAGHPEADGQYGIGSAFPDFEYFDVEKQKHQSNALLGKDFTFLVIFNPTCTHCIASAKLFQENLTAFDHAQIFYLAGEGMLPYLEEFYQETGLQKD